MVLFGKMLLAYGNCCFAIPDIVEMHIKSLGQAGFDLAYILFLAGKARNEVDQIWAFTADIECTGENLSCGVASECDIFVNLGANMTLWIGVNIADFSDLFLERENS